MEFDYLNDLLSDLEQDETFQIAGGAAASISVVGGVVLGVVFSLFLCRWCAQDVYAPSLEDPCPNCGGPLTAIGGGSGC